MKRAVVFPDQHYPIHDVKAMNVAHQVLEEVKPDIFINLGDVVEGDSVSSHRWKKKKRPPLEYQLPLIEQEVEDVNKELDKVDAILDKVGCKERYICQGNHDQWYDFFVEENPYLDHLTFRKAYKWDERGFKFYEYNKVLTIGKLSFIHGAYTGPTHAKKHLESYGTNLLYGHVHDLQRYSMTRLKDGTISAWSLGCLKDMRAEKNTWLRGRLNNWNHAVAIIDFWKNGNFAVQIVEIVKGKAVLNGKEIVG
jgi:predicted phosphodiesterase